MTRLTEISAALVLAASCAAAHAQSPKEIEAYELAAGFDMPLYRGRQMPDYNYRFNGTYYWDNLGYRTGSVCYDGKMYDNVLMNLDAARQSVYVRYQGNVQTWELDRKLVDYLTLGDTRFINLRSMGIASAPEGFFEVLREDSGGLCLRQVKKIYRESVEISGYSRIGYFDPDFPAISETLYWHPLVSIRDNGCFDFSIVTPSLPGRYILTAEGFLSDGTPVSYQKELFNL